jgi:hypothetical protein
MMLITERDEDILADLHLTFLGIGCPAYRFAAVLDTDNQRHWLAMRRTGSHAIIASCPEELLAILGRSSLSPQADLPAKAHRELRKEQDMAQRIPV